MRAPGPHRDLHHALLLYRPAPRVPRPDAHVPCAPAPLRRAVATDLYHLQDVQQWQQRCSAPADRVVTHTGDAADAEQALPLDLVRACELRLCSGCARCHGHAAWLDAVAATLCRILAAAAATPAHTAATPDSGGGSDAELEVTVFGIHAVEDDFELLHSVVPSRRVDLVRRAEGCVCVCVYVCVYVCVLFVAGPLGL